MLVSSVEPHSYQVNGEAAANDPFMAGSQQGATEPHIRGLSAPRRISAVMRAAASGSAPTSRRTILDRQPFEKHRRTLLNQAAEV